MLKNEPVKIFSTVRLAPSFYSFTAAAPISHPSLVKTLENAIPLTEALTKGLECCVIRNYCVTSVSNDAILWLHEDDRDICRGGSSKSLYQP